jgi:hypothetical protein
MEPASRNENIPVDYVVVVRPEPGGQFTAHVMGLPEVQVIAATEGEAVKQAQQKLAQWLATARLVQVKVPSPQIDRSLVNPLDRADPNDPVQQTYLEELERMKREDRKRRALELAGYSKEDPFLEEYQEEIARYRREVDERECPGTSSTPTT